MKVSRLTSFKHRLHGVQLALFGFSATLLLVGGGYLLRSWLDKEIDSKVFEAVQKKYSPEKVTNLANSDSSKSLINGSFSDTFSGSGWLAGSNIYQDRFTTGLTPFPQIDLKPVSSVPDFSKKNNCPQNTCLLVLGGDIYANGKKINLPKFSGNLTSLDVQSLEDGWILGLVYEKDKIFQGGIYIFDGVNFNSVSSEIILNTRYSGRFAFAGDSSEWLAVYGSYEGKAWEYKNGVVRDISYLLNPRVMRGGFIPEVFHLKEGWFVGNSAGGFPFLKFFSNKGLVVGALDLTDLIDEKFSDDLRSIKAAVFSGKLFLELTGSIKKPTWFEFLDSGFSYVGTLGVSSGNLRANQPRPVAQARFLEFNIYPKDLIPSLFLSNSGNNWQKAEIGKWVEFPSVGEELYWRADLSEIKEPFFLDSVRVEYGLSI